MQKVYLQKWYCVAFLSLMRKSTWLLLLPKVFTAWMSDYSRLSSVVPRASLLFMTHASDNDPIRLCEEDMSKNKVNICYPIEPGLLQLHIQSHHKNGGVWQSCDHSYLLQWFTSQGCCLQLSLFQTYRLLTLTWDRHNCRWWKRPIFSIGFLPYWKTVRKQLCTTSVNSYAQCKYVIVYGLSNILLTNFSSFDFFAE